MLTKSSQKLSTEWLPLYTRLLRSKRAVRKIGLAYVLWTVWGVTGSRKFIFIGFFCPWFETKAVLCQDGGICHNV